MTPYIREITATGSYASIASLIDIADGNTAGTTTYVGFNGNIVAHTNNTAALFIKASPSGPESSLVAQEFFPLQAMNIANMQVKGNGQILKLFGSSATGW